MSWWRGIQRFSRPSFPKAIALGVLFSAFVLVQYRAPSKALFSSRKAKAVTTAPVSGSLAAGILPAPSVEASATKPAPELPTPPQEKMAGVPIEKEEKRPSLEKPAAKPLQKVAAKKRSHRGKGRKQILKRQASPVALEQVAETLLEGEAFESSGAVNWVDPLQQMIDSELGQSALAGDYAPDRLISSTHIDSSLVLDRQIPRELAYGRIEGEIAKSDFSSIHLALNTLREERLALGAPPKAPKPQLPAQLAEESVFSKNLERKAAAEPELVRPAKKRVPLSQGTRSTVARSSVLMPRIERPAVELPLREPEAPLTTPKIVAQMKLEKAPSLSVERTPLFASAPTQTLATQPMSQPLAIQPPQAVASPPAYGPALSPAPKPVASEMVEPTEHDEGGMAYGRLHIEESLSRWLEEKRGHVELYLQRYKSRDPQERIAVDYSFPSDEFEFDMRKKAGLYRLVAGIFLPEAITAVAQIPYGELVSAATYKKRILFSLTKEALDRALRNNYVYTARQLVTATVFEGATGNYLEPKPIAGARVRILGLEDLGEFTSDKEGNVRIPDIPSRSELILEVKAEGYFPSYPIVPVFGSSAYAPLYLISKDKVDAITRYFTKSPQDLKKGLLMGRVFEPKTRTPVDNERLTLSFRRGRALYFDALPDPWLPATTKTGLFGFFNVVPSFRALGRESGKPGMLVNIQPGAATYVELGRGGKGTFRGKLVDPFHDTMPVAKVRLVGSPQHETFTEADGTFSLPGLDFPPGVLTLEVEAEGFPLTWQTVPWSTREANVVRTLYMMQQDLAVESAAQIARTKIQKGYGTLVGGAESEFFRNKPNCLRVILESTNGRALETSYGPYPLFGNPLQKEETLCLTPQKPGFAYFNLPPGQYLLKWVVGSPAKILRVRVAHVGGDRVSVIVN